MNATEFLRRLRRLARRNGVAVRVDTDHGRGSHVRVYYGDRRTVLSTGHHRDIAAGTFRAMCRQLSINPRDL